MTDRHTTMNILDEIFAYKRQEVAECKLAMPEDTLRQAAELTAPALNFVQALRAAPCKPALIAEVKCASPSKGLLAPNFDPLRLARTYAENGASAISVLTDERYFKGSLEYLRQIRSAQPGTPLLRKDFLCDPYQVYEARAAGADAVLLIVAHLSHTDLIGMQSLAYQLGMAALVEVHSREELDMAIDCGATLIGINNRDLRDFTVRLQTTLDLRPHVPPEVCLVAESGIHTEEDVHLLAEAGVDAILVGEALVTAAGATGTAAKVRELSQWREA